MKCSNCGYLAIGVTGKCPKCGEELPPPPEDYTEMTLSRSATEDSVSGAENSSAASISATAPQNGPESKARSVAAKKQKAKEPKKPDLAQLEIDIEIARQADLFAMETQDFDELLGAGRSTPPIKTATETVKTADAAPAPPVTGESEASTIESATDIDIAPPADDSTAVVSQTSGEIEESSIGHVTETDTMVRTSDFIETAQTSETLPAQDSATVSQTGEDTAAEITDNTASASKRLDDSHSVTAEDTADEETADNDERNREADATDSFVFDFGDDLTASSTSSRRQQAATANETTAGGQTSATGAREKIDIDYFVRRSAAFALDTVLFSLIVALFGLAIVLSGDVIEPQIIEDVRLIKTIALSVAIPFFFTVLIVSLCYNVVFNAAFGKTPGKIALGLKITDAQGASLTPTAAFIRWIGYLAGVCTLGVGYALALFDKENRALHDRLADTRVVREGDDSGAPLI